MPISGAVLFVLAVLLVFRGTAYAYIDPGTGGLFYQIVVLAVGVVAGYFALFKRHAKKLYRLISGKKEDHEER